MFISHARTGISQNIGQSPGPCCYIKCLLYVTPLFVKMMHFVSTHGYYSADAAQNKKSIVVEFLNFHTRCSEQCTVIYFIICHNNSDI